jgi:hypothetical protein
MNTTFYGRINDKEYTNRQEFLNDLQNTQNVTNVEYRYAETPQSAQVERVIEDKSTEESKLTKIFKDFANTHHESADAAFEAFEQLKCDIMEHFENIDDEFIKRDLKILQDEMKELGQDLARLEEGHKHNIDVLEREQQELDELTKHFENKIKKVESLKSTCEKELRGLELWSDLNEFMIEVAQDVQDWVNENLDQEAPVCDNCHRDRDNCNCGDKKCDGKCQQGESKEKLSKPDWMSQGYFNLLKEIFG